MVEGETATLEQMLPSIKQRRPSPQARSRRRCAIQSGCAAYTYSTTGGADVPRLIAKLDARYPTPAGALQEGRPQG